MADGVQGLKPPYCDWSQGPVLPGPDSSSSVAVTLIRDVGFEPVDAGPLRIARYLEPFALLMGQLAYETDAGPEVAYRFERFEK